MGFFSSIFSGKDSKAESKFQEDSRGFNPNGGSGQSLHEQLSSIFEKNVTPDSLEKFANQLSLEKIDQLHGGDWNEFIEKNYGELDVYMEGPDEGGGIETEFNELLKTYRTI